MCSTVFITSSPLHILYSLAIIKTKKYNNNYVIVWFGALPLENYFSSDFTMEYCNILDLSYLDFNHYYRGVRKHYNLFLELISNKINSIDYLFTCFDTLLGFEVIRNHFSVDWSRVGIIEDGIGNYYPNTMPKLIRQIPKSILNRIQHSFYLNELPKPFLNFKNQILSYFYLGIKHKRRSLNCISLYFFWDRRGEIRVVVGF